MASDDQDERKARFVIWSLVAGVASLVVLYAALAVYVVALAASFAFGRLW
jgi:hypothetical protein